MIVIDFETRSECDLKASGAWVYSKHPSTEVICLSVKDRADKPAQIIPYWDLKAWVKSFKPGLERVVAHNAFFEKCVWQNVMAKNHGAESYLTMNWFCTAAGARAMGLPGKLDEVTKAIHSKHRKDNEGHRLMLRMSKPRPNFKNLTEKWFESFEQLNRLFEYCVDDTEAEWEVAEFLEKHQPFSANEFEVWQFDQRLNMRGIPVDIKTVEKIYNHLGVIGLNSEERLRELTHGRIQTVKQNAKILAWLSEKGVTLPNLQAATIDTWVDKLKEDSSPAAEFIRLRQKLGKASTGKYQAFLDRTDRDDMRVRDTHLYHGASTGRWSSLGLQIHNMPRGTIENIPQALDAINTFQDLDHLEFFYDDPTNVFSGCIRAMIKAPAGKKLISADFSAIEAKVLAWMAGAKIALGAYARNEDLYKVMASYIYGGLSLDVITKVQRQLGKAAVLGNGFGMGWKKFKETCAKPPYSMAITDEMAQNAVNTYRETFWEVPEMWRNIETCARLAVENKGKHYATNKTKWYYKEPFLFCELPSGRRMSYAYPSFAMNTTSWGESKLALWHYTVDAKTKKWTNRPTYGGLLTENVVQATARDIMKEASLRVDSIGYPVIFTVHDEVVSEFDLDTKSDDEHLKEFEKLMSIKPKWALDCPISVEGWVDERYKK